MSYGVGLTIRLSYRRRKTQEGSVANALPQTERLAAISYIRLVERNHLGVFPEIAMNPNTK
jgi:hypothetical protein